MPATSPKSIVALAALCAAAALAPPARADEPERVVVHDPGVKPPEGSGTELIVIGAVTTAVWYGGALGVSYLWDNHPGAEDLRIPIAGPWMSLAQTGCPDVDPNCGTFGVVVRFILTTFTAVGQAGGVVAMMEGAFMPTASGPGPRRARPKAELPKREPKPRITAAPVSDGRMMGVGILGTF